MVVLWAVSAFIIICLQWMNVQVMIKNLGDLLDALGGYLVVRFFIPDLEALRRTVKVLAAVCLVQGAFMLNEQVMHQNLFGYLGGWSLCT